MRLIAIERIRKSKNVDILLKNPKFQSFGFFVCINQPRTNHYLLWTKLFRSLFQHFHKNWKSRNQNNPNYNIFNVFFQVDIIFKKNPIQIMTRKN